ncbi:MAG: hypothetical protein ACKVPX_11685, partial [Myxococcaceae bacterium]
FKSPAVFGKVRTSKARAAGRSARCTLEIMDDVSGGTGAEFPPPLSPFCRLVAGAVEAISKQPWSGNHR